MNILITNGVLKYRSGTETFVRDLAVKLQALGYFPMVYCTRAGQIADEIMRTVMSPLELRKLLSLKEGFGSYGREGETRCWVI
jgi:hypothetical protein